MRIRVGLLGLGIALLVGPTPASAADDLSVSIKVGDAGFTSVSGDWISWDRPTTTLSADWDYDRCGDGATEESDCEFRLRIKRAGREVYDSDADDTTTDLAYGDAGDDYELDDYATSFEYSRDWTCRRSGKYSWRMGVDLTDPDGQVFEYYRTGTFRIPKCRAQKAKTVGAGTAAARVNDEAQGEYEGEFVSQIRCGSGRKSRFRCTIQHNNNYRICTRTVSVRFFRTDRFGRKRNSYTASFGKGRCRSF